MSGKVILYVSNVSYNKEVKKQQTRMNDVLETLKVEFETVDVAEDGNLQKMREACGDQSLLAPQLFNGNTLCGGYEQFEEAVEDKIMKQFLKLE